MDGRVRAYGSHVESLSRDQGSPSMDGGREGSESLVTCSPCSRIGCHVAVERAMRSLSPYTLSGPLRSPLHLFSLFPFTCWCRALGSLRSYGREAYVKPMGLVTLRASRCLPPVLSRFRTTSIMSVYSLDQARCLWQRMNSNLNMYCRRQINIYSRDRVSPRNPPPRALHRLAPFSLVTFPRHFFLRHLLTPCLFSCAASKCNLIMSAAVRRRRYRASSGSSWLNDAE